MVTSQYRHVPAACALCELSTTRSERFIYHSIPKIKGITPVNVNTYGELLGMLRKLEHFCADIGQASDVSGWATQAEAHRRIAQGVQRAISQYLAQEGRADALVSNP